MIKVLDLFSGTQSVKKALTEKENITSWRYVKPKWCGYRGSIRIIEYIGLDIYSPEDENTFFDLTQNDVVEELLEVLPHRWIPDFIWSSPVCNKFSSACAYKGGNLFFEKVENDKIKVRETWNDMNSKSYTFDKCQENKIRYQEEADLALKMHLNGKKIIDYFNVPFAIENPRRALSKYLYSDYIHNFTSYCMYGFKYEKPTTIYSNRVFDLKVCDHRPKRDFHTIMLSGSSKDYTNGRKNLSNYANRSSVPQELIIEVLSQSLYKKGREW